MNEESKAKFLENKRATEKLREFLRPVFERFQDQIFAAIEKIDTPETRIDTRIIISPNLEGDLFNACAGWIDLYELSANHDDQVVRDQSRVILQFIRAMVMKIREYQEEYNLPRVYNMKMLNAECVEANKAALTEHERGGMDDRALGGLRLHQVPHETCKHIMAKYDYIMRETTNSRRPIASR